jgi:CRISPR-associated endoribonuclease Cas6
MRLRMTFRVSVQNTRIPLAYNEAVSTHLALWLGLGNQSVERFVFSRLLVKSKLVDLRSSTIKLLSPTVSLYLGIPMVDGETSNAAALLQGREIALGIGGEKLTMEKVELLTPPVWSRSMSFRMLSPAAVPGPGETWLAADDPTLSDTIRNLILHRYRSLFNDSPSGDEELSAIVDPSYLNQRGGGTGVVKRVRLAGPSGEAREIQGFICPVTLRGNPRLIALAYDSGLGAMGMLGFGMMA